MPLAPPAVYPSRADVPVLISVPHAGRDYPEWLIAMCKGGAQAQYGESPDDPTRKLPRDLDACHPPDLPQNRVDR